MTKPSSSLYLFAFAGIIVVALIGFVVWKGRQPSLYDGFAQCLAEKQVTMYGAWWCPHCNNQKALFGSSFTYVPYIECSPNGSKTMSQECRDAGIKGYPTWVFSDGTQIEGERTFAELAEKSGCPVPAE